MAINLSLHYISLKCCMLFFLPRLIFRSICLSLKYRMQYLNLQIIDRLVCVLEPDGVEEGTANENYHIIDIH